MLKELPAAFKGGDFEVFLQDFSDDRVCEIEALVRWRRNGTLMPPDAFIQIAEEGGLITDIDCFVLD